MRRTKSRYTWLPMVGRQYERVPDDPTTLEFSSYQFFTQPLFDALTATVTCFPLVKDEPPEAEEAEFLNDIIGSEYKLERLVGSVHARFVGAAPLPGSTNIGAIAKFGVFVAPVEREATTQVLGAEFDYNPFLADNVRQPWLVTRTWVLGNFADAQGVATLPKANWQYGDLMSGPHIDARANRRIGQNERLFGCIAVEVYPPQQTNSEVTGQIEWLVELRGLGALRKARNTSTFKA